MQEQANEHMEKKGEVARLFMNFNSKQTPDTTLDEYADGLKHIHVTVISKVVDKYKFKRIGSHTTRFPPSFPDFYEQIEKQISLDKAAKSIEKRRSEIRVVASQPSSRGQAPFEKNAMRAKLDNGDREIYSENISLDDWNRNVKAQMYPTGSIWRMGIAYEPKGSKK